MVLGQLDIYIQKKGAGPTPTLYHFQKITSKWITHLTVGTKTIKLLKQNIGVNIYNLELDSGFLGMKTKTQTIKEKIYIGLQNFCVLKDAIKKVKEHRMIQNFWK